MNALVLSGGGAKGAFSAGVANFLLREQGLEFHLGIGTSTGSLVGGPALLGDRLMLQKVYTNVRDKDVFTLNLETVISKFVLDAGPIDVNMQPLYEILADYYLAKGNLQKLKDSDREFIVTGVNARTGLTVFVSSEDVYKTPGIKPETFVNAVVASCSVPVHCEPRQTFAGESQATLDTLYGEGNAAPDDLFFDGGVRESIPLQFMVSQRQPEVIYVISTSPIFPKHTPWGDEVPPDKVNPLKALTWTLSTFLNEVEHGDLYRACIAYRLSHLRKGMKEMAAGGQISAAQLAELEALMSGIFGIIDTDITELHVITPSRPMPKVMEFDPAYMSIYFEDGKIEAEKYFVSGAPSFDNCLAILKKA